MCRFVFSSLLRCGGFDSQDFFSFIHATNDITEIVFVASPRPWTPGKLAGSRGSGGQGERSLRRESKTEITRSKLNDLMLPNKQKTQNKENVKIVDENNILKI